jgi:hypothetical protein
MATEPKWQWYASTDGENYTVGPEDTREAIIEAATGDFDGQPFVIVEAIKGIPTLRIFSRSDADIIELLDEANRDKGDPEGDSLFADVTPFHAEQLAEALNDKIEEWARVCEINPHVWAFAETRNQEDITPCSPNTSPMPSR